METKAITMTGAAICVGSSFDVDFCNTVIITAPAANDIYIGTAELQAIKQTKATTVEYQIRQVSDLYIKGTNTDVVSIMLT
jgi:hypothetical protein